MSYEESSYLAFLQNSSQLTLHFHTELLIQGGQTFVQQKNPRTDDESSGQSHSLLLTAGELLGLALGKFLHMDHFQRFPDASGDFRFCRTVLFQAVSYVLLYRHVRKQSIALKYHADIPLIYRDLSHRLTVKQHVAVFRMLESRDHSQSRRLSAAGRTENRYESSVFYFQIDMIYHRILTVDFREIF